MDQDPPRDPSLLRDAGVDEQCIQALSTLRPASVCLLRIYLHRLLVARALPPGDRSWLLEFLGLKIERQFSFHLLPPATQILRWLEAGEMKQPASSWRVGDITPSLLAWLKAASSDVQRLAFLDLQFRSDVLHELVLVPAPQRSRFLGQILDFFSDPSSCLYPICPPPQPQRSPAVPLLSASASEYQPSIPPAQMYSHPQGSIEPSADFPAVQWKVRSKTSLSLQIMRRVKSAFDHCKRVQLHVHLPPLFLKHFMCCASPNGLSSNSSFDTRVACNLWICT